MDAPTMSFDLAALDTAIAGTEFAGTIVHLPTVDSTQNLAHAAAQAGTRSGVWIADEQTAGRGRGANTWHSRPGDGLYMTVLASPEVPMRSILGLSFRTAIAVQAAIAEVTGLRAPQHIDIRWPNDLVVSQPGGGSRKTGGILIELAPRPLPPSGPATLKYAAIGIGINLNHLRFPPELDPIATSLRRELPNQPLLAREPIAAAILRNLSEVIRSLVSDPYAADTPQDPARYSTWLTGKRVRVEPREDQPGYTGITAGLTAEGFLRVQGENGEVHIVRSGGLREP